MKIQQQQFSNRTWKTHFTTNDFNNQQCQLVFAFGESSMLVEPEIFNYLRSAYPKAELLCNSTAGEIVNNSVHDNTIVVTAIQFEKTTIRCSELNVTDFVNSHEIGRKLMQELQADDLNSIFVISDGTNINGTELVEGFNEGNSRNIPVTGGLAGDGARFIKTVVGLNKLATENKVVAVGFYGKYLKVGHGSFGGWDEFGPLRRITRSHKNILYEIDGKNSLDLYKEYLGPYKEELPGSALLFPLSIIEKETGKILVRTILNVSEENKSMTFAGNVPEGSQVRLMKANFDKLIDGSSIAAKYTLAPLSAKPDLAIMISCVGRKLILQDRTDEEVIAAQQIFGENTCTSGFYSYGEISPINPVARCEFHNQTMTITTLTEI